MVMHRGKPLTCKRRGCDAGRESGHLLCLPCWQQVERQARDRYLRARRRRMTKVAGEIGRAILATLGRKPAVDPAQVYARTAAQLGEHSELEPIHD